MLRYMRLSNEQIKALQTLLKEQLSLVYTDEEAQKAGLAIMRFVLAKKSREINLTKPEEVCNDKGNNII